MSIIKLALKYANLRDVESTRAIARAHQNRNLADIEKALKDYQHGTLSCVFTRPWNLKLRGYAELASDATIRSRLSALYDTLLE